MMLTTIFNYIDIILDELEIAIFMQNHLWKPLKPLLF